MKRLIALSAFALLLALLIPSASSHAQSQNPATTPATPGSGQALEIGPPVLSISGDPGQTVKAQISLRDVSPNKLVVTNQINDFVAAGEDGTPKILLDDNKEQNPYSIKSWITPLPKFTLVPKQIQSLGVTIKIPKNAAPGGYYGVIRFTGTPPGLEGNGVALSASLGSLMLLRVNGNAKEQLSVEEFYSAHGNTKVGIFQSGPVTLTERIKNSGNIHEQPTGSVTVKDMFNKTIAELPVNQPARNILPGSIRKFSQTIDSNTIGNKFLFGKYTAKVELTYGSGAETVTSSIDFWVIPYTIIGIIILVLIALFFIIRFALKRYNQHIIGQSRRRR